MTTAILAFTQVGLDLGKRIASGLTGPDENDARAAVTLQRCAPGGLAEWASEHFEQDEALIIIGSVGIAVRAIAPHLVSKTSDPAVVVVDEQGQHVIAVLSGHIGGANALTRQVASLISATPVITTATDQRGLFSVDEWAVRQGLRIANPEAIKSVSSALLAGRMLRMVSEVEIEGEAPAAVEWTRETQEPCSSLRSSTVSLVSGYQASLVSSRPASRFSCLTTPDILITAHSITPDDKVLHLVPPVITAGVGARRGVSASAIADAVDRVMAEEGYSPLALADIASVDLKAHEPGLLAFCAERTLPLRTFSAEDLACAEGDFTPSPFVASVVGVDNVCERAAVVASGGHLLTTKAVHESVTVALAMRPCSLHFQAAQPLRSDQQQRMT